MKKEANKQQQQNIVGDCELKRALGRSQQFLASHRGWKAEKWQAVSSIAAPIRKHRALFFPYLEDRLVDPRERGLNTNPLLFVWSYEMPYFIPVSDSLTALLEPGLPLCRAVSMWKLFMAFEGFLFWVELKDHPNLWMQGSFSFEMQDYLCLAPSACAFHISFDLLFVFP